MWAFAVSEAPLVPLYDQQKITAAWSYVNGLGQHIACAPTPDTVYIVEH